MVNYSICKPKCNWIVLKYGLPFLSLPWNIGSICIPHHGKAMSDLIKWVVVDSIKYIDVEYNFVFFINPCYGLVEAREAVHHWYIYIKLNLVFYFIFSLFITVSGIQNKINLWQCNSVFVHHIIYIYTAKDIKYSKYQRIIW